MRPPNKEGFEVYRSFPVIKFACCLFFKVSGCTVPYPGVDKVKVKVNVGVKVNIRRRLGEATPSASIAEAGRRREEALPR